jgi:hypothetical protein
MRHSSYSRVDVSSRNPTQGTTWPRGNSVCPPLDFFQLSGPTALSVRNDHVDVSGAKMSQPSLLHRVG